MHLTLVERFIYFAPLPLIGLAILGFLVVAGASGNFGRRYRTTGIGQDEVDRGQVSDVISAALTLLALLLGFTFAMAVDRYDKRRALVSEEATAIAATYLMAQTFDNPHRDHISNILVHYVDNRLAAAKSNDPDQVRALLEESEASQVQLWTAAMAAVGTVRDDISSSFLQSARETIAVGSERVVVQQGHIPPRVYVVLFVYMAITVAILGFAVSGASRYLMTGTLIVLLTLSMMLIIDLDRPTSSANVGSQRAMEALKLRILPQHLID